MKPDLLKKNEFQINCNCKLKNIISHHDRVNRKNKIFEFIYLLFFYIFFYFFIWEILEISTYFYKIKILILAPI